MVEKRWLLRLVPPVLGVVAVGLVATASAGSSDTAWEPPPCAGGPAVLAAAAQSTPAPAGVAGTWYTLDPRLDAAGTLVGQRLRLGGAAARALAVELPPESAVAGPFGRLILVVDDDGARSSIRAIDTAGRCAWHLGTDAEVVRDVTIDGNASGVYEARVDRRTRADLGVWHRSTVTGAETRVVDAPPDDATVGRTFATTLGWSSEGDLLAIQSCGALLCRVRLVDPLTDALTSVPPGGELVGVAGGRAVRYEPCVGLPCPLIATDLAAGTSVTILETAGLARLVASDDGPRVAVEHPARPGLVEVRDLDGRLVGEVPLPDPDLRPVPARERALAGVAVPAGWLPLAPDGRTPEGAAFARLADGLAIDLPEVLR